MISRAELEKFVKEPSFASAVEKVFFEAMNAGYAAMTKPKKGTIAELPGSKLLPPYIRGPWQVVDTYLVTPLSPRSGGMTAISYEGVPVWTMQYFGQYEETAIPCLKAALREAYTMKEFIGGRGPECFWNGGFVYTNFTEVIAKDFKLSFGSFKGFEEIRYMKNNERMGWHSYQGGMML